MYGYVLHHVHGEVYVASNGSVLEGSPTGFFIVQYRLDFNNRFIISSRLLYSWRARRSPPENTRVGLPFSCFHYLVFLKHAASTPHNFP